MLHVQNGAGRSKEVVELVQSPAKRALRRWMTGWERPTKILCGGVV
jgi:hypothetical protein